MKSLRGMDQLLCNTVESDLDTNPNWSGNRLRPLSISLHVRLVLCYYGAAKYTDACQHARPLPNTQLTSVSTMSQHSP